jgi:hypothetical protein
MKFKKLKFPCLVPKFSIYNTISSELVFLECISNVVRRLTFWEKSKSQKKITLTYFSNDLCHVHGDVNETVSRLYDNTLFSLFY